MDAMQTSDFLLSIVKKSNLNFSISESPFSVSISIRKSFIKLRNGDTMPRPETLEKILVNKKLQDEYDSLLRTLASVENDKEELAVANHELAMKLEKAKMEISGTLKAVNDSKKEIENVKEDFLETKSENNSLNTM